MGAKDTYIHGHHDSVLRSHRWRTAENSAAYLLPHLRPGLTVLDVGCGPGTLTIDLARRVAPGRVVGIDLAAEVVHEARAYARQENVNNVSFVTGDFRNSDLDLNEFDVVHAHQVLQHLRDPVDALREMGRLARAGGLVAARDSDFSSIAWSPQDERLDRWRSVYMEVSRRNGGEPNAGRWMLRWAKRAGLSDITYRTSTWTFATPAEREWWGTLWAERTVLSALAEQAVAYGVSTAQELAELADGWRAWTQDPDAVFIVVHGEILARP